jgi:hypothetical protein
METPWIALNLKLDLLSGHGREHWPVYPETRLSFAENPSLTAQLCLHIVEFLPQKRLNLEPR